MKIINGKIVTPDDIIENCCIEIYDGKITNILTSVPKSGDVIDANGGYVLPGIIDIHGDDIETTISPRPSARFPVDFALLNLDRINTTCGITTKLHAIAYFEDELKGRHVGISKKIVRVMQHLGSEFLTHHFVHVRCEITSDLHDLLEVIESPLVKLISLMDHTPGQGQFTDHGKYREYHKKIYGLNDVEIDEIIKKKSTNKGNKDLILQKMRDVSKRAHARRIPIASHDDDNTQKVEFFYNIGVRILEFPITFDAAKKGHELGMNICMGAPNVVLGRSTSGNLSSYDAINADIVDVLCSDYHPQSMLYSVFILWKQGIMTLPDAVCMISLNPAMAVGMDGTIGSIEIGKRADMLIVSEQMGIPMVTTTIVNGNIVYTKGDVI
ncbi:MAG: alpha-D-ribose 1-methylphosphonate 5-triphosphate diphosphatase [Euryarchaeota archaeon]|nr:alpha-D-ribose 1-methylphosphonate 5-triphosphate diphosphatase [Euryarchaeota archaeon]